MWFELLKVSRHFPLVIVLFLILSLIVACSSIDHSRECVRKYNLATTYIHDPIYLSTQHKGRMWNNAISEYEKIDINDGCSSKEEIKLDSVLRDLEIDRRSRV